MPSRLLGVLCVFLTLVLLPGCLIPAMASGAEGAQVYVYAYTLKVYEKPSKKSDVLAVVPFARSVQLIAEKKDWAQVVLSDSQTGYCSLKQLTAFERRAAYCARATLPSIPVC